MTDLRGTTPNILDSKSSQRPSLAKTTARLLLATAIGGVAIAAAVPQAAQAQFVCVGNADGAAVGEGLMGTSASGDGG